MATHDRSLRDESSATKALSGIAEVRTNVVAADAWQSLVGITLPHRLAEGSWFFVHLLTGDG